MRRSAVGFSALALVFCLFSQAQQATTPTVPRLVRFAGVVTDAKGAPRTGVVGMMFSLYTEQQGGTALWTELQNVALEANGQYVVLLGSQHSDGVHAELFTSNEARWLGIQVEAEPEQPRVLLVSVPYALKAGDAETLGGKPVSAFLLNPNANVDTATGTGTETAANSGSTSPKTATATVTPFSVNTGTSGGTANYTARWLDAQTLGIGALYDNGTKVGVGTAFPAFPLTVFNSASQFAVAVYGPAGLNGISAFVNGTSKRASLFVNQAGAAVLEGFEDGVGPLNFAMGPAGGNVGIGTSSPAFKLSVVGPAGGNVISAQTAGTSMRASLYLNQSNAAVLEGWQDGTGPLNLILNPSGGNLGIGNATPAQKLSVAGTIESTAGGFKFPDGSSMASAAQLPSLASTNTFATSQVINGDVTIKGSIIVGDKKLILGGFTAPAAGAVQSSTRGGVTPGTTGFGFNILDDLGNQVVTVDTSGNYGTATLHATQSRSAAGCGQYCYFVDSPAALRGDATSTTANQAAFGVTGTSNSIGVFGSSDTAIGIFGYSGSTTHSAAAVEGYITAATGDAYAVWGGTNSVGPNVAAGGFQAMAGSGTTYGVYASSASTSGTGGWLYATALTGNTYGLRAQADSTAGVGALVNASATTGTTYGLWSRTHSTTGAAGVFDVPLSANSGYLLDGRQCDYTGTGNCTHLFRVYGDGTTYVGVYPGGTLWKGGSGLFQVYGNVGIGTSTASANLYLYGDIYYGNSFSISSRRFKKNIETMQGALDKVLRLRGVSYDLKNNGQHQIGVIAEEVGEVVPEIVAYEDNGRDAKGVDYSRLTALLIEAVKEQQTRINALEAELKGLKAKVEDNKTPALASLK